MTLSENPNIALVQRFFVAYAEHDLETMREEILAPDVTWRIPGHHPLAGVKRGAEEILAYAPRTPAKRACALPRGELTLKPAARMNRVVEPLPLGAKD